MFDVMKRTIIINEDMADAIKDAMTMTQFKFNSNVKRFLADLLEDPVGSEPDKIFICNGIDKNKLIKSLEDGHVITKKMNINDHDEDGKPHVAMMTVKYSVPKERFQEKLDALYDVLFPNVEAKINENFADDLKIMKANPLTMGVIAPPEGKHPSVGTWLANRAAEAYNEKIKDKSLSEEGGAGGATSCGSVGGVDGGTEPFNMPLFGVQRKKKYSQAINEGITGPDDDNRGAAGYIYCQNGDGKWCMLAGKRITNDDSNNLMNPPMGHLHLGEDPRVGVARECKEETGLNIPPSRFIGKVKQEYARGKFTFHFVAILYGKTTDQYEPGEGDGENEHFQWIPVDELGKYKWAFGTGKKAMEYIPTAQQPQNQAMQNTPDTNNPQQMQKIAEDLEEATATGTGGLPGEFDVPVPFGDKETLDRTPGNTCGMHNRVGNSNL